MVCFFWKSEETMKELFAALLEEDTMKRALLSVELYCFPTLTLERVLEIAKNKPSSIKASEGAKEMSEKK